MLFELAGSTATQGSTSPSSDRVPVGSCPGPAHPGTKGDAPVTCTGALTDAPAVDAATSAIPRHAINIPSLHSDFIDPSHESFSSAPGYAPRASVTAPPSAIAMTTAWRRCKTPCPRRSVIIRPMQALITDPQRPHSTRVGEMPAPPADDATVLDWNSAVEHLDRARDRWPEALEEFIGLRVPLDG